MKGGFYMDLYKHLVTMRCFTREEIIQLTGSENAARWQINKYLKKGYIERIRRNLYAVISLETNQAIPNRFQIASSISQDSCVSHHSAFEFYGYSNQVFYDVYVSTKRRFRPFNYDGISYIPVAWRGNVEIEETGTGVRVTSLERTVVDGINDFEKIGGIEELLRCLELIPSLQPDRLLATLKIYNQKQLYQKVGYILDNFRDEMNLPESFFENCEKNISLSKTYLFSKRDDFIYHERWKLFAPKKLKTIIDKGATRYDAI